MRRSWFGFLAAAVIVIPTMSAGSGSITVGWWPGWGSPDCPVGEFIYVMSFAVFQCDPSPPTWGAITGDAWVAQTGTPWGNTGCVPLGQIPGSAVATQCPATANDPPACKTGSASNDARKGSFGLVGDPVDLRSGVLSLDPVDIDLGHGLRLARHYASKSTLVSQMGKAWVHGLDWSFRRLATSSSPTVYVVKEPLRPIVAFVQNGAQYTNNLMDGGSLTSDAAGYHYTSSSGVAADFDSLDRIVAIRLPGEQAIAVTYSGDTATFSNGSQTLAITKYPSGHANAGLVSSVTAAGENWSYSYNSGQYLTTVVGPDPSTPSPTDTITWTYIYVSSRVVRVDRTATSGTTTLGSWAFDSSSRVTSADEQALEQPLSFSYYVPQTSRLQTTVKNSSNQVLALFDSTNGPNNTQGAVNSVTNSSGPAAPVAGGPGVAVPFKAATRVSSANYLTRTETDQNGNVTLYESYDGDGRPGRVVEGWVDGTLAPGVFSPDDTFAALNETTWHPSLREPLTDSSPSVLPGGGTRTTIFDYDDPAAPGDNPLLPNQAPTQRLYSRTEQGYTPSRTATTRAATSPPCRRRAV